MTIKSQRRRVIIMGAAGQDFHNFHCCYRDNPDTEVVAVCAVRTGCGKSAVTRRVVDIVRQRGQRPVVIRHPMPYGDLADQRLQRFASFDDLDHHHCTIEEREEYEPHLEQGTIVYAGVDYHDILAAAEREADVMIWDGGNNDLPFIQPDVHICLVDPHRPGHESQYYPGSANLLMADIVVVAKEDTAEPAHIQEVKDAVQRLNPRALVIDAASPPQVGDPALISGQRVLVVEDGPTLTHGGLSYGAGSIAAKRLGASECVDPVPYAQGSLVDVFRAYPALQRVLPAMGYSAHQVAELEATINAIPCDTVVFGTPIDLRRVLTLRHPAVRVRYDVSEIGQPTLADALPDLLEKKPVLVS